MPTPFAKFTFRPKPFEICDLRFERKCRKNNTDNIKTKISIVNIKDFAVGFGGADNLALFPQINGSFRRGKIGGRAGFYFDKNERCAVVSNEINLGVDECAAPVSTDGCNKIRRDEPQTAFFEKFRREFFAAFSK